MARLTEALAGAGVSWAPGLAAGPGVPGAVGRLQRRGTVTGVRLRRPATVIIMGTQSEWVARTWLLYLLAGIVWVSLGAVVLGGRQGLGLIFIGLVCLAFGVYGAGWRLSHGYGLVRLAENQGSNRR